MVYEGVELIKLTSDWPQWRALVNKLMPSGTIKGGECLDE